jgi:hypothetical protein
VLTSGPGRSAAEGKTGRERQRWLASADGPDKQGRMEGEGKMRAGQRKNGQRAEMEGEGENE